MKAAGRKSKTATIQLTFDVEQGTASLSHDPVDLNARARNLQALVEEAIANLISATATLPEVVTALQKRGSVECTFEGPGSSIDSFAPDLIEGAIIAAVRSTPRMTRHGCEKLIMRFCWRSLDDPCENEKSGKGEQEDKLELKKKFKDRREPGSRDLAIEAEAFEQERIGKATADDIRRISDLLEMAKDHPPESMEGKKAFASSINRLLDVLQLRIQAQDGNLYRLRVLPGTSGKGFFQLIGAKERANHLGFKSAEFHLAQVPATYWGAGKQASPKP